MLLQGRGKNDEMGCVRAILLWWTWRRDGGLFVRLVVHTKRTRSKFVVRPVLTSLRCWHSPSQLASSTNTRQVQNVYEGQSHVPVQPLASSTLQNAVRIHGSDRDRVIIANQVTKQSHPIHSAVCNQFFPSSTPCARVLWRATSFIVQSASESWTLQIRCT